MSKINLCGVVWWPHSGGRWLCRSLIKSHPEVLQTTFVHPWQFFTTDMTLELDITSQVHKARSLPELKPNLAALKESTDHGRIQGLKRYFEMTREGLTESLESKPRVIVGEMCLGSPIPRSIDLEAIFKAMPDFKIIHLVRTPLESFPSFAIRHEMDSDPIKVAGSWLTLNSQVKQFFDARPDLHDQFLLVKYEDLLSDLEGSLKKIGEFLEIDFFRDDIELPVQQRWGRNTKKETDPELRKLMENIARPLLEAYGYL